MVWKVVNIADTGTSIKFGADDTDKINKAFNGTNVADPIIYQIDFNTLKDSTTNAAGDLLKGNGTKYVRFARGSSNQILGVNSGGTDLEWKTSGNNFDPAVATTIWRITTSGSQIFEIGPNTVTPANIGIDFHTDNADGDYRSRIIRQSGANADLDIINTGTANIDLNNGMMTVGPKATGGSGVKISLPDVDTSADPTNSLIISQTVTATAATAVDFRPIDFTQTYLANNVSTDRDLACTGLHIRSKYGDGSHDAKGNMHGLTLNSTVDGCVTAQSEIGNIVSFLSTETEAISMWSTDLNLHGPIAVQPGMLVGLSQFINNYYNGSPVRNTSAACGLYTKPGSGGGTYAAHDTATTYPIDTGIVISGISGTVASPTTNGFNIGIQIGGGGGSWLGTGQTSKIGTGIKLFHCVDHCIDASSQGSLTGYVLKLPDDGVIGRSGSGKLSWSSADNMNLRANNIKMVSANTNVGSDDSTHYVVGYRPDLKKYGTYHGGTASATGDGLLAGRTTQILVGAGPPTGSAGCDSTGVHRLLDTSATINNIAGLKDGATFGTRINNAYFKSAIYLSSNANVRVYCGLVASIADPASAADPLNALAGVGLWFDSAVNANWRRYHNDSSGAGVSDDTGVAVAASTLYTVEIEAVTDTKFVFRFNGTSTDISTDIPGSTTTLGFWVYIENTTGASKVLRSYYIIIRTDK